MIFMLNVKSVFQICDSTETALIRVCNDVITNALEKHDDVILIVLDLSATFDPIDHDTLLCRLNHLLWRNWGM